MPKLDANDPVLKAQLGDFAEKVRAATACDLVIIIASEQNKAGDHENLMCAAGTNPITPREVVQAHARVISELGHSLQAALPPSMELVLRSKTDGTEMPFPNSRTEVQFESTKRN